MTSLGSKAFRGMKWTYVATVGSAVVQIGYSAVVARLLEPEAFGLVALAMVVLRFGSYFGQMGVGSALIQLRTISPGNVRAAFTSSLLLGAFFFGFFWLAAPGFGRLFGSADLAPVVRVLCVTFIVNNLSITAQSLLRRRLEFRLIAIVELASYVVGYCAVGILMALHGWGVWSLVGATLGQGLVSAVLFNALARHPYGLTFSWPLYRPLYGFGSKVSLISFLQFLSSSLDTMMIGSALGPGPLGIYNRAFMLVQLPIYNLSTSISKVIFPALSAVQDDDAKHRRSYLALVGVAGAGLIAIGAGMAVGSREIVRTVLGQEWDSAVPVLRILSIATPLHFLSHFCGVILEARGALRAKLKLEFVYLATLALLLWLGGRTGLVGFAIALAIGMVALNVAYTVLMARVLELEASVVMATHASALITGAITAAAILAVSAPLNALGVAPPLVLLADVATGAAALLLVLRFGPQRQLVRATFSAVLPTRSKGPLGGLLSWLVPAREVLP